MAKIAVDMDEVIADTFSAQINWYLNNYKYTFSRKDCFGKNFKELVAGEHATAMENLLVDGRFFETLPVMAGAQAALLKLSKRFEIFIATSAMEYPNSFEYKYRWLQKNMRFITPSNIVFCGDKSIISADYLIDDNIHQLKRFSGQGLLFTSPHNALLDWQARVNNWNEVLQYFEVTMD